MKVNQFNLGRILQLSKEKAEIEELLGNTLQSIKDLEQKLHQKTIDCENLKAIKTKDDYQISKRRENAKDLKDCLTGQDLKMSKFFDPGSFDLTEFTAKIQNLKKYQHQNN